MKNQKIYDNNKKSLEKIRTENSKEWKEIDNKLKITLSLKNS